MLNVAEAGNEMRKKIIVIGIYGILLCIFFLTLVEVTTLIGYHNFFTAGELFAWITANPNETTDIAQYCLRFILPYYIVCSLTFLLIGWGLGRLIKQNKTIIAGSIVLLMLLPFVIPFSPANIFHEGYYVWRQIRNIRQHQNDNIDFMYNAARLHTPGHKEIYILAIGESLRYKNLSLNGNYARETTPLLRQQNNLCLYSDYYANATLTQHALPMMLTGVTPEHFEEHFGRKTIATAFSEAGFKNALVSHRAQLMNNGCHNYLAKDFDTIIYVQHDSLIAQEIAALAKKNEKLFTVTHYLGNHLAYTNRTEDCLVWRPDYNADPTIKNDSALLNAYDNSLLYTDRMFEREIETLQKANCIAAWLLVSDHGEYINGNVCGHGFSYTPQIDEYHVPLMVWYSDKYKEAYPEKVANLIKHKDAPVCADHVFWSVLDMANIQIDSMLQQKSMSIFEEQLKNEDRTLLLPNGESIKIMK